MRIKKIIKSLFVIFLIFFVIVIIVSNSKYMWNLFGYTFCEEVENIQIYSLVKEYNSGVIVIKGKAVDADGYYTGYIFHIKEDKLYVGLKYNKYYGYENKAKDFEIEIPCKLSEIKSIYLTDGINERKI